MPASRISSIARALGDPTRARIVAALMAGTAHTAGELARHARVAASTTSAHLGRLVDAGLVSVEPSGRHRYYRIASGEVADLIEQITAIELHDVASPTLPSPPPDLAFARSCYDHLAGELAVQLYVALGDRRLVVAGADQPELTADGEIWFTDLGIDLAAIRAGRRPTVRTCIDWTQRRHHLGGALGAALLEAMFERGWLKRRGDSRVLRLTQRGRSAVRDRLGVTM